MSAAYTREEQTGIAAVRTAAAVCRSVQSAITTDALEKKDRSPVTIADFSSQAVICRALEEAFPEDPIIGEEDSAELQQAENAPFLERVRDELEKVQLSASPDEICRWIDRGNATEYSRRFWTLDPIDGTKGFLRGEQYAISLALIVDGEIQLAILGCPNLPVDPDGEDGPHGAIFAAVRGAGCYQLLLDGEATETPVRVSPVTQPSRSRFCESIESGHSSHSRSAQVARRLGIAQESRRLDSQAKYAVVARGEAEIYLRLPSRRDYQEKIWDHAGGVLLVQEAGGRVSDLFGKALEWTHGSGLAANRGIIATNGPLHEPVLKALAETFSSQ